jgi:hypothetical protein
MVSLTCTEDAIHCMCFAWGGSVRLFPLRGAKLDEVYLKKPVSQSVGTHGHVSESQIT